MVKVSAFSAPEQYVAWATAHVQSMKENGLRLAYEHFDKAVDPDSGYKESWLRQAGDDEAVRAEMWEKHLDWLEGRIEYLEREIRKYERDIRKVQREMEG